MSLQVPRVAVGSTGMHASILGMGCSPLGHSYGVSECSWVCAYLWTPAGFQAVLVRDAELTLRLPGAMHGGPAVHRREILCCRSS